MIVNYSCIVTIWCMSCSSFFDVVVAHVLFLVLHVICASQFMCVCVSSLCRLRCC